MEIKVKLIIEAKSNKLKDIVYVLNENEVPHSLCSDCPKKISASLLEEYVGIKINPYEPDWVVIRLLDCVYENDVLYLIFGCNIIEDGPLIKGNWISLSNLQNNDLSSLDESILKRFIVGL